MIRTSLSDTPLLHDSCAMALKYPEAWATFRSLPGFLYAIDCFPESLHLTIRDAVPHTDLTPELFAGDIGRPPTLTLSDGRKISPTMLRYAAISRDLGRRFQMHHANVVEIGCGFGGQRKVIWDHYESGGLYVAIDIQPMRNVAERYMDQMGVPAHFAPCESGNLLPFKGSWSNTLLISNYALSEMERATQEMYFDKVIRHCPRGYMLCNNPDKDFDSMTTTELAESVEQYTGKKCRVEDERPKTGEGIKLLTWGKHD